MTPAGAAIRFGTDGWRAIMADTFTVPNVELVAQAIAGYVISIDGAERGVVVGHDNRFLAEMFADACTRVLTRNGVKVYRAARPLPTPVVAHSVVKLGAAGAIMLTASHNPPEYNGIKFIPEYGGPAGTDITAAIEQRISAGTTSSGSAESREIDPVPAYLDDLAHLIDGAAVARAGMRVGVDFLWGAGRGILDVALVRAGCEAVVLHEKRDVLFGGAMPDPNPEILRELGALVSREKLALGVALDGDADRFGILDPGTGFMSPNQVLAVLAAHLLGRRGLSGALVRTVATTHALDAVARRYGVECLEVPVGFKWVGEKMRERDVVLGGEESGGMSILGHLPEKDGFLADLLMVEACAMTGKSPSSLLAELETEIGPFHSKRIDLHLEAEARDAVMASLADRPPAEFAGRAVGSVVTVDGVKLLLEGGEWVLLRPSGTEPLIRCYLESSSPDGLSELEQAAGDLVNHAVS